MPKHYPHVGKGFRDRHGKVRYRFRRKGYPQRYINEPFGTKAFEREYAACLAAEAAPVSGRKITPGSVSDVIARYYADNSFQDLRETSQRSYRGILERFREDFGDCPIRIFDAERISRLMAAMRHKPYAASQLRKMLTRLFVIARRAKIVPFGFNPIPDTKAPKLETEGYHRWSEEELTAFENSHPLGSTPRLAFALLLYGAQRSGDVRCMTADSIVTGRVQLSQSKTTNAVDVPIVEPLMEALEAGPLGKNTLLENRHGEAFTAKAFYHVMKRACIKAGIPHCSPHGLRKSAARRCREAGCSDDEGMAITGHKSVKEYRRYAGEDARGDRADTAMAKVMANRAARLANHDAQAIEIAR